MRQQKVYMCTTCGTVRDGPVLCNNCGIPLAMVTPEIESEYNRNITIRNAARFMSSNRWHYA